MFRFTITRLIILAIITILVCTIGTTKSMANNPYWATLQNIKKMPAEEGKLQRD